MSNLQRFLYAASIIVIISALAVLLLLGYWLFFPQNIVAYPRGMTFPMVTKEAKLGSYVTYKIYYCKYKQDVSTVYITLVGSAIYTLPPVNRTIPIGCGYRTVSDTYIPVTVPPGKYHLEILVRYHPNPVRTVDYYVKTTDFTVIP